MLPGKTYTPKDILGIARRRLWLLPLPLVTLFGALLYSSRLPDIYQASTVISIVPQRVPDEFVRTTVTLKTEERLNAITVQVRSRSVLEPMIGELDLYPSERAHLPMEDVVLKMQSGINVGLERMASGPGNSGPSAFHVQFTYPDPAVAARVTTRLGSIFVDQNARDRGALATATDDFLQLQLKEARQRLETVEKRMEAFRQKHGNELPTQLQSNVQAIQSVQLQVQALVEGIARDRDRKLMLERLYQEAQNEPAVVVPPPPVAATAQAPGTATQAGSPKEQLAAARTLLDGLQRRLTPEHPDIVRTKRLIAELEQKAAALAPEKDAAGAEAAPPISASDAQRRDRLRSMRAELESLDRQTQFKENEERRLRALVAEYQRRIEAVPGIESEWSVLTRDYDTQQTAYKELLSKSESSKVALDLENRQIGENFRVLDPARVPVNPVSPKRVQISAIGFALGIGLALGIIALLEFKDESFRTEAEVTGILSLPVLAVVPYVETDIEKRRRMAWRLAAAAAAVVLTTGAAYVFWALRLWTVLA